MRSTNLSRIVLSGFVALLAMGLAIAVSDWLTGTSPTMIVSASNNNNSNGNGNGNGNGNSNNNNSNKNANENVSTAISTDPLEAVVGAQPNAPDTEVFWMDASHASSTTADGVVTLQWVSGGTVQVTEDPIDASTPTPPLPAGLKQLRGANLELIPLSTPNQVNLILHYTDQDVASNGVNEATVTMYYYNPVAAAWLHIPGATTDTNANTVTWTNVDISIFGSRLTRVSVLGGS